MRIATERVTRIELERDEAVILRRVLSAVVGSKVMSDYDAEGRDLAARITDALVQQIYVTGSR